MHSIPKILILPDSNLPTITLTPQPQVYKTAIRRFLITWLFNLISIKVEKRRVVTLDYEYLTEKKSFCPVLRNEQGVRMINKTAAEKYLRSKINLPKIINAYRDASYEGSCPTCDHFYVEHVGSIELIGNEVEVTNAELVLPPNEILPPNKARSCRDKNCSSPVTLTLRFR